MEPFHADWFGQYKYDNYSIRFEMKKHYSHSTNKHMKLLRATEALSKSRVPMETQVTDRHRALVRGVRISIFGICILKEKLCYIIVRSKA